MVFGTGPIGCCAAIFDNPTHKISKVSKNNLFGICFLTKFGEISKLLEKYNILDLNNKYFSDFN